MYESLERYIHRYSQNLADRWRGTTKVDNQVLSVLTQQSGVCYSLAELYPQMDPVVRALHFIGVETRESVTAIHQSKQSRLELFQRLGQNISLSEFEELFHIDRYDYSGIHSRFYHKPYSRSEELKQYKGVISRTLHKLF